jgi:hypothetical protein
MLQRSFVTVLLTRTTAKHDVSTAALLKVTEREGAS